MKEGRKEGREACRKEERKRMCAREGGKITEKVRKSKEEGTKLR